MTMSGGTTWPRETKRELESAGAAASMREHPGGSADAVSSYLDGGASAEAVGAFFRAAARLYRAKPRDVVPTDQDVIEVEIPALGMNAGVISVVGENEESFGLRLFATPDDFTAYLEAAEAIARREPFRVPSHRAIDFDLGDCLPATFRHQAAEHGWEVAAPAAFPWLAVINEDMTDAPPSPSDVTVGEAISLAVAEIIEDDRDALVDALARRRPFRRSLRVKTFGGDIEVIIVAPARPVRRETIPQGPLAALAQLEDEANQTGEIDAEARTAIVDELVAEFATSPEAQGVERWEDCRLVLRYAADYLGDSLVTLEPRGLREVLFELVPSKVWVEPARAKPIVEATRAFFAFMKRAHGLPRADACLRVLEADAVEKLERALSDPGNFGVAKSMMMAGEELGFDMRSDEGRAWMTSLQSGGGPLALAGPSDSSAPSRSYDTKKKKDARKAARKARRKNR